MSETANSSTTTNTDSTFVYCFTKWEQLTLPLNKKIKSIAGTGTETIILTEFNELYSLQNNSEDDDENNEKKIFIKVVDNYKNFYKINFTLIVKNILNIENIPKIKEIFCNYSIIILQLENDEYILIGYDDENIYGLYIKDNFKMLATCALSSRFIAINSNNQFKCWEYVYTDGITEKTIPEKASDMINNLIKKGIKILSCGGDFSVIVTENDNKMYVEGPNTFNSQSGVNTEEFEYTYLQTPFEEMSEIKQVKCGYFHTIVLLNNGKVFASGYNLLGQCGHENLQENKTFMEFLLPVGLNVKEFGCTSRGTYFTTTTNDNVYFIGEVVEELEQEKFGNVKAHCLSLQYSSTLKFNTIVTGGWHYIVYFKNVKAFKSLIYFKNNLQKLLESNNVFVDIYFN
ncbi:hypothetical protein ABK040_012209 [Willaertia magna]